MASSMRSIAPVRRKYALLAILLSRSPDGEDDWNGWPCCAATQARSGPHTLILRRPRPERTRQSAAREYFDLFAGLGEQARCCRMHRTI